MSTIGPEPNRISDKLSEEIQVECQHICQKERTILAGLIPERMLEHMIYVKQSAMAGTTRSNVRYINFHSIQRSVHLSFLVPCYQRLTGHHGHHGHHCLGAYLAQNLAGCRETAGGLVA